MKKIEAIIPPFRLDDVKDQLTDIGVQGLTVSETTAFERHHSHKEHYRGTEYVVDSLPSLKLEIVVGDEQVQKVIDTVSHATRSEHSNGSNDTEIFVLSIDNIVRIRTGERDHSAI